MQFNGLGWSNFALTNSKLGTGNSYSTLSNEQVVELVLKNWDKAIPGNGELDLSRKILVPVPKENFFCQPYANLVKGMPIQAELFQRQDGEEPYIENYVKRSDAEAFNAVQDNRAESVFIVCYHYTALLENNGNRSCDTEWEIVTILCEKEKEKLYIPPLTMARNFLQKTGGTFTDYSNVEFAESIWHYSIKTGIKIKG